MTITDTLKIYFKIILPIPIVFVFSEYETKNIRPYRTKQQIFFPAFLHLLIKYCIEDGARVDVVDDEGYTPLHLAVEAVDDSDYSIVQLLLQVNLTGFVKYWKATLAVCTRYGNYKHNRINLNNFWLNVHIKLFYSTTVILWTWIYT